MDVNEARRLKQLVANLSLNQEVLKAVIEKMYGPPPDCKREPRWWVVCVNVSGLLSGE